MSRALRKEKSHKARVLRRNNSVLEIGRDLVQRNEFVAFMIGSVVNPGLQPALDVHRGRWVDPSSGQKDQRGKRPKKHRADDKPSNQGSEKTPAKRRIGRCYVWLFTHTSEY